MKTKPIFIIGLLLLIMVYSCEEEYWPEIDNYENLLVVDGYIHTGQGPYKIILSLSSPVQESAFHPLTGCEVAIQESTGFAEMLDEVEPGIYMTSPDGIRGQAGHKYKVTIKTKEGKKYESKYKVIPEPIGIDTVYAELEYKQDIDMSHDLVGYRFILNSQESASDTTYFFWNLTETYEFTSDFYIDYIYQGYVESFSNFDSVYKCWKTETVPEIFIFNTANLSIPQVKNFQLNYVTTETKKLTIRYSLLVEQFTVDYENYMFWKDINNQITEGGGLFTTQPFQVRGNVKNVNNPEEAVLGYFMVAGISTKRIFVNRPSVDFYYSKCNPITDLRGLGFTKPTEWPIYLTVLPSGKMAYSSEFCFDCTLKGGKLDPPEFWTYQ